MSRASTAASRGYSGDVSAGSVYASASTSGTVRTPDGTRVPRPVGDPTGEGYARQYVAYQSAGGSVSGMAVPTYQTTIVTPVTPAPSAAEKYQVSGRGVTAQEYYAARQTQAARTATQWQQQKVWERQQLPSGVYRTMPRQVVSELPKREELIISGKVVSPEEYAQKRAEAEQKAATSWQSQKVLKGGDVRAVRAGIATIPDYYSTMYKTTKFPTELAKSEWERWQKGTVVAPVEHPSAFQQLTAPFETSRPFVTTAKIIRETGKFFGAQKYQPKTAVEKFVWSWLKSYTTPTGVATAGITAATMIWGQALIGKVLPWALSKGVTATKLSTGAKVFRYELTALKWGLPAVYGGSVVARTVAAPKGTRAETLGKIVGLETAPMAFGAWAGSAFLPKMETKVWRSPAETEYRTTIKTQEGRILPLGEKAPIGSQVNVRGVTYQRYKSQLYWGEYPIATAKYGQVQRTFELKGALPTQRQADISITEYGKKGYARWEAFATPKKETTLTGQVISKGMIKPSIEETVYLGKLRGGEAGKLMKVVSAAGKAGEPVFLSTGEMKGVFVRYPELKIKTVGWGVGFSQEMPTPSTVRTGRIMVIAPTQEVTPSVSMTFGKTTTTVTGKALIGYKTVLGITGLKELPVYKPVKTTGAVFGMDIGQKLPRLKPFEYKGFQIDLWTGKGVSVPARPPTKYEAKYGTSKGKTLVAYIPAGYKTGSLEPTAVVEDIGGGGGGEGLGELFKGLFKGFELGGVSQQGQFSVLAPITPERLAKYQQGMLYDMGYTIPVSRGAFETGRTVLVSLGITKQAQQQIQQQQQKQTQMLKLKQQQVQKQQNIQQNIQQQIQHLQQKLIQTQGTTTLQITAQSQQQVQQQAQQQQQIQQQIQQLQQKQIQRQTQITTPNILKIVPKVPITPQPFPKLSMGEKMLSAFKVAQAFKLFVKRAGQYKLIGVYPKGVAIKKGQEIALGTLAASFKLQKAGETMAYDIPVRVGKQFRTYKIKKGKQIPLELEWIQKRKYRLGTRGEVSEIQFYKRKKSKGGAKWL